MGHFPVLICIMQCLIKYHISRNIDGDFNLAIRRMHQNRQINLCHYQSIYTISIGFSPYITEIHQFKILPTALFEQTAKYNVHQYVCLYSIMLIFWAAYLCEIHKIMYVMTGFAKSYKDM